MSCVTGLEFARCVLDDINIHYYVSSESYGLGEIPFLRDVMPGEVLKIDDNGITSIFVHPKSQLSLCTFEILYFSNENSIIDNYCIKKIRKKLAIKLALRMYEYTSYSIIIYFKNFTGHYISQERYFTQPIRL